LRNQQFSRLVRVPGRQHQTFDIAPQILRHFKIYSVFSEIGLILGRIKLQAHL
jgi:hypothetical protein